MKKVLYIDGVGVFGGACRSLFENIKILKDKEVDPYFIIQKGSILKYYGLLSKNIISVLGISRFDNTKYSYYKGLRWLILIRELFFVPFTLYAFIKAKVKWREFDVIHINELTEVLPIIFSRLFFKAPIVVHCRSLYHNDSRSFRNKIIKTIIKRNVSCLIAIDKNVYNSIPKVVKSTIINNSYLPITKSYKKTKKANTNSIVIGYAGSLSKMKGIYELIECFKLLKEENLEIKLLVAGDIPKKYNPFTELILKKLKLINQKKLEDFKNLVKEYGIENNVSFLGNIENVSNFYKQIDVIIFPTHLDAPGRPIIEAAYFGIPSIVTVKNPQNDTLIHGVTGIAIPTNEPNALKINIIKMYDDLKYLKTLGHNAYKLYLKNFNPKINSNELLKIYENVK